MQYAKPFIRRLDPWHRDRNKVDTLRHRHSKMNISAKRTRLLVLYQ